MAFAIANFKEVGGAAFDGNSRQGGQSYSCFSVTDTLATMTASGYFNDVAHLLNVRDCIQIAGSDGIKWVWVATNDRVTVTVQSFDVAASVQSLSGAGAVDVVSDTTEITTTGADALTLANGTAGQIKKIVMVVDGGNGTLTPTTALGFSTIVFTNVGDSVLLQYGTGGWSIIGVAGAIVPSVQSLSGAGAVDVVTETTEWTTTGADAGTLADGTPGQIKKVVLIVDGGDGTLTPATGLGYTTITFADAGDSVILQFGTGGWAVIGSGGLGGGPVVA